MGVARARSRAARAEEVSVRWFTTALAASGVTWQRKWQRIGSVAVGALLGLAVAGSGSAELRARTTVFTGYGFDACNAPTQATLNAWLVSPYRALGIYIGGANRTCANEQLTSDWVASALSSGWSLIPLYVGLQAPCASKESLTKISPPSASTQGTAAADDAIARLAALALPAGSPIYFDMEGYSVSNPTCSQTVQSFLSGWVIELHAQGYLAGAYGSAASTIRDVQALGSAIPDDIWIGNWNGQTGVFGDPYVSDSLWTNHQRLHQYRGGHHETYGGITINIDNSYVDGAVVAATGTAPPPVTPPPLSPPSTGGASTAGSVSSDDGQSTASWPAGTFGQSVVVTLTQSTSTVPGFATGGYGVQLQVQQTSASVLSTGFALPVTIHIGPQSGKLVPLYSTNQLNWSLLPQLVDNVLPSGDRAGYGGRPDGSFDIQTTFAGYFALVPDTTRPTAPAALDARFAHGSLVLRWPKSTDNSGAVASYEVTLTNRPLLSITDVRTAAVTRLHHVGPSVYRVVAIDSAGNESEPSKPVVVLPSKRPPNLPKALPAWAWNLFNWQQQGKQGTRPDAPRIVPGWYWQWSAWRAVPFHIRRP